MLMNSPTCLQKDIHINVHVQKCKVAHFVQLPFSFIKPRKNICSSYTSNKPNFCVTTFNIIDNLFCGVMVKALDFEIVVSEFELQSRYYVHFRTCTLGKGLNLRILTAFG